MTQENLSKQPAVEELKPKKEPEPAGAAEITPESSKLVAKLRAADDPDMRNKLCDSLERHLRRMNEHLIRVERLGYTDELTGLPNERAFRLEALKAAELVNRYGHYYSVVMVDLDRFKLINDTFGHAVGDLAIQIVAEILHDSLRQSDYLARLHGEEFAILIPISSEVDRVDPIGLAYRLNIIFQERFKGELIKRANIQHSQDVVEGTISVGFAEFDAQIKNALDERPTQKQLTQAVEEVFKRADTALYAAKAGIGATERRNNVVAWYPELEQELSKK